MGMMQSGKINQEGVTTDEKGDSLRICRMMSHFGSSKGLTAIATICEEGQKEGGHQDGLRQLFQQSLRTLT